MKETASGRARVPAGWLLFAILVAAAALRLWAVRFGLPAINDPDELVFELSALKMLATPSLNPHWFGHPGTTTLYVLALVDASVLATGYLVGWFPTLHHFATALYADPSWVVLPARIAMIGFGVWSVALTWRLGKELFGPAAALVAAALMAVDPLHITYSQVVRSDIMATVFSLLMLLATLRVSRTGSLRDTVVAAIWFGLATTSKWPFAACAVSFAAVALWRWKRGDDTFAGEFRRCVLFGLAGIAAVIVISPYLVLDHETALRSVAGESQVKHLGATGQGLLWNAAWYVRVPLLSAFGWVGMALVAAGLAIAARHREARVLLLPLIVFLSLVMASQHLIWERWALPVLPYLSIFAGSALVRTVQLIGTRLDDRLGRPAFAMILAATIVPLFLAVRVNATERLHDTRQVATRWAEGRIPAGKGIIIEHFGFDLLSRPWNYYFPLSAAGCVDARAFLKGKVQYNTIASLRGGHHNVDYGTLDPARRGTCNVEYAFLSQYDRYMAEATDFPAEVAAYRELMSRSTLLATIKPKPGVLGGPTIRIIRIDRPYAASPSPPFPAP